MVYYYSALIGSARTLPHALGSDIRPPSILSSNIARNKQFDALQTSCTQWTELNHVDVALARTDRQTERESVTGSYGHLLYHTL